MKIFPYSLVRLSGLTFPKSNQLLDSYIKEVEDKEKTLIVTKASLLQELADVKTSLNDYFEKQVCLNLIRDLRQDRSIKFKPRFDFLLPIKGELEIWNSAKKEYKESLELLNKAFETSLVNFRAELKKHIQLETVQIGIQLSSRSAYRRLQQYLTASNEKSNKKLRQAELTALKYYTRASTKTSPFAGFGPLAWIGTTATQNSSVRRLNQVLLIFLEEYILTKKDLAAQLDYRINPSCWQSENEINFLVNHRNVEEIKVLPTQELLSYLLIEHRRDYKNPSTWVNQLSVDLEIEVSELVSFIETLIEEGFFVPVMPCDREDTQWLNKWLDFSNSRFKKNEAFIKVLTLTTSIKSWSAIEIEKCHKAWSELMGEAFNLDVERFYYQDDYLSIEADKNTITSKFSEELILINQFIPKLQSLGFSKLKAAILKVFDELNVEEISLLAFYKIFHQKRPIDLKEEIQGQNLSLAIFDSKLRNLVDAFQVNQSIPNEIFKITKIELENLFTSDSINKSAYWYGAIFQSGKGLPFLRHVFNGHAKMMSRFINDRSVVQKVLDWNSDQEDVVFADHSDSSAFNANLHPKLTDHKIASIKDKFNPNELIIDLSDLYLTKYEGSVILRSRKIPKQIIPLNYGLEGLDRRSPLYQLIQGFGTEVPDFNLLTTRLNQYLKKVHDWGFFLPSITLANKIVIQRSQWHFENAAFEKVFIQDSSGAELTELFKLFAKAGAPLTGYMRQNNSKSTVSKKSAKPQFYNFAVPTYLLLLKQTIKNSSQNLIWESVYPEVSNEAPFESKVQEWVVEWRIG